MAILFLAITSILKIRFEKIRYDSGRKYEYHTDILGRIQGEAFEYNSSSELLSKSHYKNDQLDGYVYEYYGDESVSKKVKYIDSNKVDTIFWYYQTGEILRIKIVSNQLIEEFSKSGNLLTKGKESEKGFSGQKWAYENEKIKFEHYLADDQIILENEYNDSIVSIYNHWYNYKLDLAGEIQFNLNEDYGIFESEAIYQGDTMLINVVVSDINYDSLISSINNDNQITQKVFLDEIDSYFLYEKQENGNLFQVLVSTRNGLTYELITVTEDRSKMGRSFCKWVLDSFVFFELNSNG